MWNLQERPGDSSSWPGELDLRWLSTPSSDGSKRQLSQGTSTVEFLQLAQCAYADDLVVASSSFRELMFALAPAFRSVGPIAGLNLNYRKCCWVQYGTEGRDSPQA